MTVKELKEMLANAPEDGKVYVYSETGGYVKANHVGVFRNCKDIYIERLR